MAFGGFTFVVFSAKNIPVVVAIIIIIIIIIMNNVYTGASIR